MYRKLIKLSKRIIYQLLHITHVLFPKKLKEQELNAIKRLSKAEVLEPYRTQRLSKDGRIVDAWLNASSLVDEKGNLYAIATTEREAKNR